MNKNLDRYMPGVGRSRRGFSFELTGSCATIRRLRGILPAHTLDSLDGRGDAQWDNGAGKGRLFGKV